MHRVSPKLIRLIFTATIFLSAGLLFFIQPLFARLVLPYVGGASSVWTTAMLFFQTVLLLGYIYAHLSARYLSPKLQIGVHLAMWALALLFLPIAVKTGWLASGSHGHITQTLVIFALGVGLPFAVLSANAPLLQKWYARSNGPSADDPYFLYSASNVGSLLALLAFPLVAEPLLGARQISFIWSLGFVLLGAFLFMSGGMAGGTKSAAIQHGRVAPLLRGPKMAVWVLLAAIPSSLMLTVTSKISTDIGSFPLVWIIPLALYLVTFIYAFSGVRFLSDQAQKLAVALALTVFFVFLIFPDGTFHRLFAFAALIACFFIIALVAHRRLHDLRPAAEHLTTFYILISLGGVLGGLFNSVVAITFFRDVLEFPIVLALSGILLISGTNDLQGIRAAKAAPRLALMLIIGFFALTLALRFSLQPFLFVFLPCLFIAGIILMRRTAWRGAGWVAGMTLLVSLTFQDSSLFRDRSFFGIHRVSETENVRLYSNGTTVHGAQLVSQAGTKPTPLTYYHPKGPMGQVFSNADFADRQSVGIVGLGIGSLVCYRQPGQDWHLYEIDKAVDDIARNPALFDFMPKCGPDLDTYIGDARLVLQDQDDLKFDLLVIDAFSSDAVPVHLMTTEALSLYLDRLNPGGVILFHISNRYFNLRKPLASAAGHLQVAARVQAYDPPKDEPAFHATSSVVVAIAKEERDFGSLLTDPRWTALTSDYRHIWTDDFSNPPSILY